MNQKNSSKFKCITKKKLSCKIGYLNKIKEKIDINLNINKQIRKKNHIKGITDENRYFSWSFGTVHSSITMLITIL
jgi:hypothetical protein